MDKIQEIEHIIEELRKHMHETAEGRCFNDPEVVKASQELDQMLNKYARLITEKCKMQQRRK